MRLRNHFTANTATHSMRVTVQLHAAVNYMYTLSDAQQSFLGNSNESTNQMRQLIIGLLFVV